MPDETTTTLPVYLQKLSDPQWDHATWSGPLALENVELIAGRLRRMLDGRRYTWVATVTWREPDLRPNTLPSEPEVRAGMVGTVESRVCRKGEPLHEGSKNTWTEDTGFLTVHDDYGVGSLHTSYATQRDAWTALRGRKDIDGPHNVSRVSFDGSDRYGQSFTVEHWSPSGNHLWWKITAHPEKYGVSQAAIDSFRRAFNAEVPALPGLGSREGQWGGFNANWAIHQGLVAAAPHIEGVQSNVL